MTALGRSSNDGVVRLRTAGSGKGSTGVFSLPAAMARIVPENALFSAEWHDDGILYRFRGIAADGLVPDDERPGWLNGDSA